MSEAPWLAPPEQSTRPRPVRHQKHPEYPWDEWFAMVKSAGDFYDLVPGRHFPADLKPENFRKQVAKKARERDVAIKTHILRGRRGTIRMTGARSRSTVKLRRGYKWDLWLNGENHLLVQDLDFAVPYAQMVNNIHVAANRRGLKARTTLKRGGLWMTARPPATLEAETPQEVRGARTAAEA